MRTLELVATRAQQEIINCRAKFRLLIAGRRYGKTIGVVTNDIIAKALGKPGSEYLSATASIPQVKLPFDLITNHAGLSAYIKDISTKHYPLVAWYNGSRTHFRTMDQPDLLRGNPYDFVWLDEIQLVKESAIDRVILPTLADRRGKLGMSGQGRGEEHWIFNRFFLPGQDPKNWGWCRSWQFSIRDGIRFQSQAGQKELELLEEVTPPDIWEEEYEGKFVSSGRCVFRSLDIQGCLRGTLLTEPEKNHSYILSIDIGRVADPSAWIIWDCTTKRVVHAEVRPFREHHQLSAQQAERLRSRFDAICVVDKTGYGQGSASHVDQYVREYEKYVKRLLPFLWTGATKKRIIDGLALGIEKHIPGIPPECRELRRQLGVYEFRKKGEFVICTAPDGDHDDLVAALAMAWNADSLGWGSKSMNTAELGALL